MVTKERELNGCLAVYHWWYSFALLSEVFCTGRISDKAAVTLRSEFCLDRAHRGYIVTEQNAGAQRNI
jgi:hypothetical protein